jgi:hypothetical protein
MWCSHSLLRYSTIPQNFIISSIFAFGSFLEPLHITLCERWGRERWLLDQAEKKIFCVQANCIDSTAEPEAVFAGEVKKMQAEKMKPQEQVGLVITYIVGGV